MLPDWEGVELDTLGGAGLGAWLSGSSACMHDMKKIVKHSPQEAAPT